MDWFSNPIILTISLLVLYVGVPALAIFVLYKIYQTYKHGRGIDFDSMPELESITTKNVPVPTVKKIEAIDQKAKKLLGYYDSKQIKDEAIMGENQFLVKKILNEDLPEAIADYQRLDNTRANQMAVGTTGKTALQLLNDYLDTINEQFDDMLDAMYEQNAQKLLVSNRYLQSRFEDQDSELNLLTHASQSDGLVVPPPTIQTPEPVAVKIEK